MYQPKPPIKYKLLTWRTSNPVALKQSEPHPLQMTIETQTDPRPCNNIDKYNDDTHLIFRNCAITASSAFAALRLFSHALLHLQWKH